MGLKTRLSSNCTKRGDNAVNLVTSRKTNARLVCPIEREKNSCTTAKALKSYT